MITPDNTRQLLQEITQCYETRKKELSGYDAVIGDGDHGYSIARGCAAGMAAVNQLSPHATVQECFKEYGRELTNEIGGAMGPLFGLIFTELAKTAAEPGQIGTKEFTNGIQNAMEKITELGGAMPGDKTMVDAMAPAAASLQLSAKQDEPLIAALTKAAEAARQGVEATIAMQARRGRSKYMQEKSIGHQDAGATSFYYLLQTVLDCLKGEQL